jgi:hypothetical protein
MRKGLILLFVIIVLATAIYARVEKPVTSVPCPFSSTLTGNCRVKIGTEAMMANSAVPVGLGDYTYVEVVAPKETTLTASVVNGNVWIMGEGSNTLKLLRRGTAVATVNVTVKGAEYPVQVEFTGYGKP